MTDMTNDRELLSTEGRAAAHDALTEWLDSVCGVGGKSWESGRGGYVGTFKLEAHVGDDGVSLTVETSFPVTL